MTGIPGSRNSFQDELQSWDLFSYLDADTVAAIKLVYVYTYRCSMRVLIQLQNGNTFVLVITASSPTNLNIRKIDFPLLKNIDIKWISSGTDFIFIVTNNGDLYARGYNLYGQIGNGSTTSKKLFHRINWDLLVGKIRKVVCGGFHTLALNEKHEVYGWGRNDNGELGLPKDVHSLTLHKILQPKKILTNVKDIDAGHSFSVALTYNGEVFIWGTLCSMLNYACPSRIDITETVTGISCGLCYLLCLTESGIIYAMGENKSGCLGLGFESGRVQNKPVQILNYAIENIYTGHLGRFSSCFTKQGKLLAWGLFKNKCQSVPQEVDCRTCDTPCRTFIEAHGRHGFAYEGNMKFPLKK